MARSTTDIQLDLTAAYAARRSALTGGEEYSMDTGQGRQSVKRPLAEINRMIAQLEEELNNANDDAQGGGGLMVADFRRHP